LVGQTFLSVRGDGRRTDRNVCPTAVGRMTCETALLAITQGPYDASTRYRVEMFRPFLEAAGVTVDAVAWPVAEDERRAVVEAARRYDAVVVQRRLLFLPHVIRLRRAVRRLSFDFDDAVMLADSANGIPVPLLDKCWQFAAMVASCDAVTAGNAHLAGWAGAFADRRRIVVIPTTVDAPVRSHPRSDSSLILHPSSFPVLVWIGQRSTLPYLLSLERPLRALSRRFPGLTLRVIADAAPVIEGVRIELRPWSQATEYADLADATVGLAPLPDDPWTRGKCGLRLLQYLAAGVPAVASPVGTQREIIDAGAAMPARREPEWTEAVARLLADAALRASLIHRGSRLVAERFTAQTQADAVIRAWCGSDLRGRP